MRLFRVRVEKQQVSSSAKSIRGARSDVAAWSCKLCIQKGRTGNYAKTAQLQFFVYKISACNLRHLRLGSVPVREDSDVVREYTNTDQRETQTKNRSVLVVIVR